MDNATVRLRPHRLPDNFGAVGDVMTDPDAVPRQSTLAALDALRDHLRELQLPQIVHRRRAIILFEGPEGAGKKFALRQLASAFDPCHVSVHPIEYDRRQAVGRPLAGSVLASAPGSQRHGDLLRSWYRRVLDDRILGRWTTSGRGARVRRDQRVRGAATRLRHAHREALLRRFGPTFKSGG